MPRLFTDLTNAAERGEKSAFRALQAWQYLIAKARDRQIAQYEELRVMMGYADNRPLSPILGRVMFYREYDGLPPLTLIVVNQSGVPGKGFTAEQLRNYHRRREDVFNYSWYDIVPPTVSEFHDAHSRGIRERRTQVSA